MRGLLYIRLFFAFVPRSALEGKRRNFRARFGYTLFKAMSHCAENLRARQSDSLCIASEIVAKLFLGSSAQGFIIHQRCSVEKCVDLRGARIEILSGSPE